jgi:hypothetical protein
MMASREARHHFLVVFSGAEDDDDLGRLAIIYYI